MEDKKFYEFMATWRKKANEVYDLSIMASHVANPYYSLWLDIPSRQNGVKFLLSLTVDTLAIIERFLKLRIQNPTDYDMKEWAKTHSDEFHEFYHSIHYFIYHGMPHYEFIVLSEIIKTLQNLHSELLEEKDKETLSSN